MIPAEKQQEFDDLKEYADSSKLQDWNNLAHYIEYPNTQIPAFTQFHSYNCKLIYNLFRLPQFWDEFEAHLILFLKQSIWLNPNISNTDIAEFYRAVFIGKIIFNDEIVFSEAIKALVKCGFTESGIWFYCNSRSELSIFPFVANFVVDNADKYLSNSQFDFRNSLVLVNLLIQNRPDLLDKYLPKILEVSQHGTEYLILNEPMRAYLMANPHKHEAYLVSLLSFRSSVGNYMELFNLIDLIKFNYPDKYQKEVESCTQAHIELIINSHWEIGTYIFGKFVDLLATYYSIDNAFEISRDYLFRFTRNSEHFKIWLKKLKQYETAMTPNIVEHLWLFARHADKSVRQLTAQHIAKTLGETAIPEASTMLLDKKADVRLAGALILSLIKTEKATAILRVCIADEMNDEVRNAMLEGVSTYLVENTTIESVAESVLAAQKRGKLVKSVAAWLVNYPQLTYKNGGNALDSDAIAFLFYRMSQAKDIRTDIEARPLLSLIDRETSAPFAKWLLDSYFQNSADAKLKWCLTLGAVLGSEQEVAFLQRNIVSFVENSRGKMAEYVVKALALQGSQRALRAVDFFSRKYKNKSIGKAALEAFDVAAEELNMTPYELADSVIPYFGFDGLFKEFEANKETYRAYIGNDFKLAFLDEDNKNLKALPKGTSAALKDEFKEIGKEIRDIVKSQSSRLEQYLVIQRRWSVDKWEGLFLTNPVMFIYAVRLIWGIFDEKNTLINVFRCQEDQSLTDKNGDEIDFDALENNCMVLDGRINSPAIDSTTNINNRRIYSPENTPNTEGSLLELQTSLRGAKQTNSELNLDNQSSIDNKKLSIGMVHPISLAAETIDFWKNDLLDNGIEPIFPQLNRRVIALEPMDKSVKMSDAFNGVEIGGYTFLSRMEKAGWVKGSIGDGGCILSYYKTFTEVGLVAIVMQTGGLSVSYYDVNAEIGNLMFVNKEGVRFGSYMYDEPSKMNDPRLVAFGDVPPIVYSEVMADMAFFKENQVK